jgi:hypothetical protein
MERKAAKELIHIHGWLDRVDEIVERGKDAYLADHLLWEAGDSLMMKLGAAANRNFLTHQYDEINRELTWLTLSHDLPAWKQSLATLFDAAGATISEESGRY